MIDQKNGEPYWYTVMVVDLVALRPRESTTFAVMVMVPVFVIVPVVREDALALPMLGSVSMLYDLMVDP